MIHEENLEGYEDLEEEEVIFASLRFAVEPFKVKNSSGIIGQNP